MNTQELIFQLRTAGYAVTTNGQMVDVCPADDLSPEMVAQLKQSKAEILAVLKLEQQQGARQQKVLAMLDETPDTKRIVIADTDSDPASVILTIAIRGVATFEMTVDRAKYDPWQLLAMIDQIGADNVH